ncbi:MAG TPA: lipopolysaccharide heptosyltransferase II [Candidatus Ozemobacteraceae bacterium]|nr:lipopolysaccharide heptosyltransferase II [Candidatus Ozemobacteraceae bacterium]
MKTLFLGLNWIGDIIMSFPALAHAAARSGGTVDVLSRPALAPVYSLLPCVGRIIAMDTKRPFWRLLPEISAVRKRRYDRISILPRSFRTAFMALLCGGTVRRGYGGEGRSLFLHEAVPVPAWAERVHESRLHLALASEFIPDTSPDASPAPMPHLSSIDQAGAQHTRNRFGLPENGSYAVLAPGAAFGDIKRWPAERFAMLGVHLRDRHGLTIVVTGTAGEAALTANVASTIGRRAIDLAGRTSLCELFDILSGATLLACNDSGTMHLGAALKTPLLVPVGPTDMNRTGPMSDRAAIVTGLPCPDGVPCRKHECRHGNRVCLDSVTTEAVSQAADNLLQ